MCGVGVGGVTSRHEREGSGRGHSSSTVVVPTSTTDGGGIAAGAATACRTDPLQRAAVGQYGCAQSATASHLSIGTAEYTMRGYTLSRTDPRAAAESTSTVAPRLNARVPAQMWAVPAQMCLKADAPAPQRNMREGGIARLCAHGSDPRTCTVMPPSSSRGADAPALLHARTQTE